MTSIEPEKFIARPYEVEAFRFTVDSANTIRKWMKAFNSRSGFDDGVYKAEYVYFGGSLLLEEGDWVYKVRDKFYSATDIEFLTRFKRPEEPKLQMTYDAG